MVDAIGAFVVDRADTASVAEMSLASDVLQRLMRDVETTVRRKLAERLAPEPKAPPALIRLLANDEAEVARPVLAASEALQDEVVYPYQSEQFGAYAWTNASGKAHPATLEFDDPRNDQWRADALGLRTRAQTAPASLVFSSFIGDHIRFSDQYWDEVVLPLLD